MVYFDLSGSDFSRPHQPGIEKIGYYITLSLSFIIWKGRYFHFGGGKYYCQFHIIYSCMSLNKNMYKLCVNMLVKFFKWVAISWPESPILRWSTSWEGSKGLGCPLPLLGVFTHSLVIVKLVSLNHQKTVPCGKC